MILMYSDYVLKPTGDRMNDFLITAGILSIGAAILHLAIILKGPDWYRFFGAGERMAIMAEKKSLLPAVITLLIALVLFSWGLYAFSAAGLFLTLPFIKPILIVISAVYLVRGLVLIPGYLFIPHKVDGFAIWSSIVSFIFGLCYVIGTYQVWNTL